MSRRKPLRVMKAALTVVALVVFTSATAGAAEPNAPSNQENAKPAPEAGPVVRPTVRPAARPSAGPVIRPTQPPRRTPASFNPDMPFSEAIEILRNSTTPPLNIVVLWKEIEENAGIDRRTPIGMDGVSGIRLRQCLDLLLLSVSGGSPVKLGWVVNNGVVTVGTTDSLPAPKRVTRIYDISDLVAPPSMASLGPMGYGGMGYGNMGYGGMNGSYGGNMGYGNMGYGNMNSSYGGSMGMMPYMGNMGMIGPYRGR